MNTSDLDRAVDAVQQLLGAAARRVQAAQHELDAAEAEHERLEAALRLVRGQGAGESDPRGPTTHKAEAHLSGKDTLTVGGKPPAANRDGKTYAEMRATQSIRAIVQTLLEEHNNWFAMDDIVEHAFMEDTTGKPLEKIRHNVRSSLWSLRQKDKAESNADGQHRSTKWRTDSEATSAGQSAEAASGSIATTSQEGGEADGIGAHPDGDLRPVREEDDLHQGLGAPVGGSTTGAELTLR